MTFTSEGCTLPLFGVICNKLSDMRLLFSYVNNLMLINVCVLCILIFYFFINDITREISAILFFSRRAGGEISCHIWGK